MAYHLLNMGFDRGNERTNCAAIAEAGKIVEFDVSSMIAEGNLSQYNLIKTGSSYGGAADASEKIVQFEDTTYFLADFASQGKKATNGFGDLGRYHSKHTKIALMCYAAMLAQRVWPYQNVSELAVNLVMGVPIQAYRDEAQQIVAGLSDSYRYKFNGRDMLLSVNTVRVFMEGAGAAIYHGLDRVASVGVVDSGSFTTNILRFDGTKANAPECASFDVGVGTAVERLNTRFEQKYGRNLSSSEQQSILRASIGQIAYPEIYVDGEQVSGVIFHDWMKDAIAETGQDRNTRIASLWSKQTIKSFKTVLHAGGGSYYFHTSLQQLIKSAKQMEDAEKTNARGFAVLAHQIAQRQQQAQRGA